MIKAAIFDVDGTLLDTTEFIYQAFEHAFKTHKVDSITREHVKKFMGKPLTEIYQILAPSMDSTILADSHRSFQKENLHLSKPYLKVEETLEKLKQAGIKMAVITSRSNISSVHTLDLAGISHYFEIIISSEDVKKLKPDPESIFKVLKVLQIKPEEAVMIGDTYADVQAGKNAGTKTIAVSYGFHGEEVKKHNPDYMVYSFIEILPIILYQTKETLN